MDAKHLVHRYLIPVALASIVSSVRSEVLLEAGLSFLLGDPSAVSLGTTLFYAGELLLWALESGGRLYLQT